MPSYTTVEAEQSEGRIAAEPRLSPRQRPGGHYLLRHPRRGARADADGDLSLLRLQRHEGISHFESRGYAGSSRLRRSVPGRVSTFL